MTKTSRLLLVVIAAAVAAVAAYLWWASRPAERPIAEAPGEPAPAAPAQAPSAPAIANPIEAVEAAGATAAEVAQSADVVADALVALLGREKVLSMLNADDFVRRVVATVDNLARERAPVMLWPVRPTPGRFAADEPSGGAMTVAAANAARYDAFVTFVRSIDVDRAVALYVRLYPRFQKAYEELGYPRGYFNDRLVEVIDHLLDAPEPASPVALTLTQVRGSIPAMRPWVRYEFADPALESMSAGRKILVRVGPAHEKALKATLRLWRERIARPARRP